MAKNPSSRLSHIDRSGRARMVDVSGKPATSRRAVAEALVRVSRRTVEMISTGGLPKGNAIETARLAGIMAAKRTHELIPLCHQLPITHVSIEAECLDDAVRFVAEVRCSGPTGVEMEALTAAAVAGLALYDMIKAVEREAVIEGVRLLAKEGGKSGPYRARVRHSGGGS